MTINPNTPTIRKPDGSLRIIKRNTCPKISPSAEGELTYEIGHEAKGKAFYIRVAANSSGGFFSHEWIPVSDIERVANSCSVDGWKAIELRDLYGSTGANNHGFLAAACRSEGILVAANGQPYMHKLGNIKAFKAAMNKLVRSKVNLKDEVAEQEQEKAERREALAEKMRQSQQSKKVALSGKSNKAAKAKAPAKQKASAAKKSPRKKATRQE